MRLKAVSEAFDDSRFPPGAPIPDVVKLLNYRKDSFGTPMCYAAEEVMRGPSDWTVGERELMAALVSRQNQCPFCVGVHSAVASIALDDAESVGVALDDLESASIPDGLRATCALLTKFTNEPESLTRDDIDKVRDAGVGDVAIADAMHVGALFCVINRCANALDFELMDDYAPGGRHPLLELGYVSQLT